MDMLMVYIKKELEAMKDKQKEDMILNQIASFLVREELIKPDEQIRFLEYLKREA